MLGDVHTFSLFRAAESKRAVSEVTDAVQLPKVVWRDGMWLRVAGFVVHVQWSGGL